MSKTYSLDSSTSAWRPGHIANVRACCMEGMSHGPNPPANTSRRKPNSAPPWMSGDSSGERAAALSGTTEYDCEQNTCHPMTGKCGDSRGQSGPISQVSPICGRKALIWKTGPNRPQPSPIVNGGREETNHARQNTT